MSNTHLDSLEKELQAYRERHSQAEAVGKAAFAEMQSFLHPKDTSSLAAAVGAFLIKLHDAETDDECAVLAVEWAFDHYWAHHIDNHRKIFDDVYDSLVGLKATFDDRLVYGDIDVGLWVVPHDKCKIVCSERYCSAADDNIHVWVSSDMAFSSYKCSPDGENGNQVPSWYEMLTYQKLLNADFFQDRLENTYEVGCCFCHDNLLGKCEKTLGKFYEIYWSLWHLRCALSGIEEPCQLPGSSPTPQ